jgi:16S rRNA G966 N2-methylase RsmD
VCNVLKKNLEFFDTGNCSVFLADALQFTARLKKSSFDIIFADPPYSDIQYIKIKDKVERILKPGGVFCMEMKKLQIDIPDVRVKHYGSTQVVFWRTAA